MKKEKDIKKFDDDFKKYFEEKDVVLHEEAVADLLDEIDIDLGDAFIDLLDEEGAIENFFLMWERAGELEKDPHEKKHIQKLGKLSKEYFNKKEYKKLYELFFDTMFHNFANYVKLRDRKDFDKITDLDLYDKSVVPPEIFLQYFLMESPIKMKHFDWERSEDVMMQNLACLIICFGDIYEFFNID